MFSSASLFSRKAQLCTSSLKISFRRSYRYLNSGNKIPHNASSCTIHLVTRALTTITRHDDTTLSSWNLPPDLPNTLPPIFSFHSPFPFHTTNAVDSTTYASTPFSSAELRAKGEVQDESLEPNITGYGEASHHTSCLDVDMPSL